MFCFYSWKPMWNFHSRTHNVFLFTFESFNFKIMISIRMCMCEREIFNSNIVLKNSRCNCGWVCVCVWMWVIHFDLKKMGSLFSLIIIFITKFQAKSIFSTDFFFVWQILRRKENKTKFIPLIYSIQSNIIRFLHFFSLFLYHVLRLFYWIYCVFQTKIVLAFDLRLNVSEFLIPI